MPLTESRDRLRGAILDLLWSQWTELGVAGTRGTEATVIDPEALLMASLTFARYDPRLFDEMLDWLKLNGAMLDVTRLRRLARSADPTSRRLAAAVVELMLETTSGSKWEPTARRWMANETPAEYSSQALFIGPDGSDLPTLGAKDEFFGSRGFSRPVLHLRGMSGRPRANSPALLRLAARDLVGIGVRAETLVYLWTHESGHGRGISARTGYSQRQVAEYLAGLSDAGFAEHYEEGRTVQYRLVGGIGRAVGTTARYVDWAGVYRALVDLHAALATAAGETEGYEASVGVRAALVSLKSELPLEGFDAPFPAPDDHPGERIIEHVGPYVTELSRAVGALS